MEQTQLTDSDYIYLYPLFTPEEIKEEFGAHSKSPRSIQKLYSEIGYPTQRQGLRELLARSIGIADITVPQPTWYAWVWFHIAQKRKTHKEKVWEKINYLENYY